jgi:hypothetical protein
MRRLAAALPFFKGARLRPPARARVVARFLAGARFAVFFLVRRFFVVRTRAAGTVATIADSIAACAVARQVKLLALTFFEFLCGLRRAFGCPRGAD